MAAKRRRGNNYAAKHSSREIGIVERRKAIGKRLSFAAAEAYKLLRTNLIYSMADEEGCKIIGVTSALRGEGKSTTSLNLAYTLAQSGKQVLLLEADMRLPVQADVLKLDKSPGLSEILVGEAPISSSIRYSILLPTLAILPGGSTPPNPAELLSSNRMIQVLKEMADSFEYIIVDLPPVNAVSDSLIISDQLSGMLVVVRREYCEQALLAEAMRRMELLKVKVLGFVLTGAESDERRYKKYGYRYSKSQKYGYSYGSRKEIAQPTSRSTDKQEME